MSKKSYLNLCCWLCDLRICVRELKRGKADSKVLLKIEETLDKFEKELENLGKFQKLDIKKKVRISKEEHPRIETLSKAADEASKWNAIHQRILPCTWEIPTCGF